MASHADDIRQARERIADIRDDFSREASSPPAGSAAKVAMTTTITTYPTTAKAVYALLNVDTAVTETEGAVPSFATVGPPFFGPNLGTAIPPNGTPVLATQIDGSWFFTYG